MFVLVNPTQFRGMSQVEIVYIHGLVRRIRILGLLFVCVHTALSQHPVSEAFIVGEQALRLGDLDSAEKAFRRGLRSTPNDVGAHVNLGVIQMKRQRWVEAISEFRVAQKLAPNLAGIPLNIGLAYYRQNNFVAAIEPFQTALRLDAASDQARYLLGLCYFLTERYAEAVSQLDPLWDKQADNMQYLYALGISAGELHRSDLESRAMEKLLAANGETPQMRLLRGKAYLARDQKTEALRELTLASTENPRLPFVNFYLGATLRQMNENAKAAAAFQRDAEIEPDVAFNYEQLGEISLLEDDLGRAETFFRKALQLDNRLAASHYGLAKVLKQQNRYAASLAELDAAANFDPQSASIHYLRGQVLMKLSRTDEARHEMALVQKSQKSVRDDLEQKISGVRVNPTANPPEPF